MKSPAYVDQERASRRPRRAKRLWALGLAGLVLVSAVGVAAGSPPARSSVLAGLLLPHFFPGSVPRPLRILTATPQVSTVVVPGAPGHMVADIYRPMGTGPFPAMILMLGVNPLPRTDAQVVTLAEGIARTGIITVVAESEALLNGEIRFEEVDNLVALVDYLTRDPSVDAERVGFSGFCIGAVLELLAAEDERIANRISYVNAFSVYAFASDVLRAILTQSMPAAGGAAGWTPSALTREVFLRHMIEQLPFDRDRDALRREIVEQTPLTSVELQVLSREARQLRDLLRATEPAEVDRLLAELPPAFTQGLARLSPGAEVDKVSARLFLMHDRADSYLPVAGARRLAELAEETSPVTYTEFKLFEHVVPGKVEEPRVFLGEMVKLYRHIQQVLHTAQYTRSHA